MKEHSNAEHIPSLGLEFRMHSAVLPSEQVWGSEPGESGNAFERLPPGWVRRSESDFRTAPLWGGVLSVQSVFPYLQMHSSRQKGSPSRFLGFRDTKKQVIDFKCTCGQLFGRVGRWMLLFLGLHFSVSY